VLLFEVKTVHLCQLAHRSHKHNVIFVVLPSVLLLYVCVQQWLTFRRLVPMFLTKSCMSEANLCAGWFLRVWWPSRRLLLSPTPLPAGAPLLQT
jgi:hypothetical protein